MRISPVVDLLNEHQLDVSQVAVVLQQPGSEGLDKR